MQEQETATIPKGLEKFIAEYKNSTNEEIRTLVNETMDKAIQMTALYRSRLLELFESLIKSNKVLDSDTKRTLLEWQKRQTIQNVLRFFATETIRERSKKDFNTKWEAYLDAIHTLSLEHSKTPFVFHISEFALCVESHFTSEEAAGGMKGQSGLRFRRMAGFDEFQEALKDEAAHTWIPFTLIPPQDEDTEIDWLRPLIADYLHNQAKHETKIRREADAKAAQRQAAKDEEHPGLPMKVRIVTSKSGDGFTRMPKIAAPISHLLSSGPLELARVDGETYAAEPEAAKDAAAQVLRPRNWDIVPKEWTEGGDGRQLVIPGLIEPESWPVAEYLVATATNAATAARGLPQAASKLLPHMLACVPQESGAIVKGTLQQLTEQLNPGRRVQPRDRERTGAALAAIKSLRVVPNINGRARPMEFFTVVYDLSKDPESMVGWCLNPFIADAMLGGGKMEEAGGLRRGFYLVNYSRLMAMDTKKPGLFPLYLRISAIWNDARYDGVFHPERVKPIIVDELAFWMNALPRTAAEYLQGKKHEKGRKDLSEARLSILTDLQALKKEGLIGEIEAITTKGKPWTVRPMPPADMLEAYKQGARGGGKDK